MFEILCAASRCHATAILLVPVLTQSHLELSTGVTKSIFLLFLFPPFDVVNFCERCVDAFRFFLTTTQ